MFLCSPCFELQQSGEVLIPPSIIKKEPSPKDLSSDNQGKPLNTIMIKRSKYEKYLQFCTKEPFIDPQFPPSKESLKYEVPGRQIIWKRISQIVPNCVLFEKGIQNTDIQMGNVGDRYFLPTISALARYPHRIETIFNFNLSTQKQCIYRLIVKDAGVIMELVIDDYVPVFKETDRPVFCKANVHQIWVMLLEKAWAKLKGSYGAIIKGCPHEVFSTFCIAPSSTLHIIQGNKDYEEKIWQKLKNAYIHNYVACATTSKHPQSYKFPPERIFTFVEVAQERNGQSKSRSVVLKDSCKPVESQLNESEVMSSIISVGNLLQTYSRKDYADIKLPFDDFLKNFQRVDITQENGSFNSEFLELKVRSNEEIFFQFQVNSEDLKAEEVIAIYKQINLSYQERNGSIRMIFARKFDEQTYEYIESNHETYHSDCFISLPKLIEGRYILYVKVEFPQNIQKPALTLFYSWKHCTKANFRALQSYEQPNRSFISQVFLHHCVRENSSKIVASQHPDDWIRSVNLFQKCGFGYVACSVSLNAPFKLGVEIDQSLIEQSGLKLLGDWDGKQLVMSGSKKIFIFELIEDELETDFPPKGFKVSKII